ncbi:glycosyltransferase family 2 protein [Bradyrhizobium sp. Arg314]
MTEASVVICAYTLDRCDDLNAAVAATRRQIPLAREIILVVNNSEALLEHGRQEIEGVVVTPNANLRGLCGGRMARAGLAMAQVAALLHDDAIPNERCLDELPMPYAHPACLASAASRLSGAILGLGDFYGENRPPSRPNPARGSLAFREEFGHTSAAQGWESF